MAYVQLSERQRFESAIADLRYGIRYIRARRIGEAVERFSWLQDYIKGQISRENSEISKEITWNVEEIVNLLKQNQTEQNILDQAYKLSSQAGRRLYLLDPKRETIRIDFISSHRNFIRGNYQTSSSQMVDVMRHFFWLKKMFPMNRSIEEIAELSKQIVESREFGVTKNSNLKYRRIYELLEEMYQENFMRVRDSRIPSHRTS